MSELSQQRLFWNEGRLKRFLVAIFIAFFLSLTFALTTGQDSPMLRHGDFPGFYAPAVILSEGDSQKLYDLHYQREVEGRYWEDFREDFYIFAYPPYVARMLVPLAWLSPGGAQIVFMFFQFFCVLGAGLLLKKSFPDRFGCDHIFFLFLFPPLLTSIVGTQNSGLSMLLFSVFLSGLKRGTARGDLAAGIACGLFLYKPQYGVFFFTYLFVTRNFRSLLPALVTAACLYGIAAIDMGMRWPIAWYTFASSFGDKNFVINSHQMVSLTGGWYSFVREAQTGYLLSAILAAVFFATLLYRSYFQKHSLIRSLVTMTSLGFVAVILSPQTLYYDLSICLPAVLLFLKRASDKHVNFYFGACVISAALFFLRAPSAVSYYFIFALILLFLYVLYVRESKTITSS